MLVPSLASRNAQQSGGDRPARPRRLDRGPRRGWRQRRWVHHAQCWACFSFKLTVGFLKSGARAWGVCPARGQQVLGGDCGFVRGESWDGQGRAAGPAEQGWGRGRAGRMTSAQVDPSPLCLKRQQGARPALHAEGVAGSAGSVRAERAAEARGVQKEHRDPNQATRFRSQALVTRSADPKRGWGPSRPGHVDEWTEALHSDLRWAVTPRTRTLAAWLRALVRSHTGPITRQPVLSGPRACRLHSQPRPAPEQRGAAGFTSRGAPAPWSDARPRPRSVRTCRPPHRRSAAQLGGSADQPRPGRGQAADEDGVRGGSCQQNSEPASK